MQFPDFSHKARKRFGQNFLNDDAIIQRIINIMNIKPNDHLVEIGPGQGALTHDLLEKCQRLDAIELDRDLIEFLKTRFYLSKNFYLHSGDALKFNFESLVKESEKLRIVGNLPYNISTPLLFHLLASLSSIVDIHIMLQKEVVDRLVAAPATADYGRLSIMIQYHCRVEHLIHVPCTAFKPQPKVQSAIVRLTPYSTPPYLAHDFILLSQLVRIAFMHRRKTLRNNLKGFLPAQFLDKLNVDLSLRPETLSVEQYVQLANQISDGGFPYAL